MTAPPRFARLIASASLLLTAPAFGQSAAPAASAVAVATVDADPALWVVRDADTTVYLFGTVHLLRPGLSWFDEAVADAFAASDELVTEIDEASSRQVPALLARTGRAEDGVVLTARLSEENRATYVRAMQSVGLPAERFEAMEPWVPGMLLSVLPLVRSGYDPNMGVEATLRRAAQAGGKRVSALETAEMQIGFFDALPPPAQLRFLTTAAAGALLGTAPLDELVTLWAAGDADGLGDGLNRQMADYPDLQAPLLTNRNRNWANWVSERIAGTGGTYFVAVGAGHLAGEGSVQQFLRNHGLTAERVRY